MKKFATLLTAAALVAGISGPASSQGLVGLGAGATTGLAVVGVAALTLVVVVATNNSVTATTSP